MEFSVAQEVYVFLSSAVSGIFICVVYDLLRVMRSYTKISRAITDVQDIIFWCIAIFIMFFMVFHTNRGYVRWYEFFGVFLGAVIYFFVLSEVFCNVLKKIIDIFLKIFIFFCKILLTPLVFTYNIIYKSILFIFAPIFKILQRFARKLTLKIKIGYKNTKSVLLKK